MPTENSRFNALENGLITELISTNTQLFYNPTLQQARAIFNGATCLKTGEKYEEIVHPMDILHVNLNEHMFRCLGSGLDPVTGTDLSTISVLGIQLYLKKAYDTFHNEHAAVVAAAIAAAEAAAAAANDPPAYVPPEVPAEPTPDP